MSDTPLMYAVQRLNWTCHGTLFAEHDHLERLIRLPGSTRLASHDDEALALADCAQREEATRRIVNPFRCHGPRLAYQTSLDEDRLHDWLLDGDIEPPARRDEGRDWLGWWEQIHTRLTELQWAHVWKALDRVVFHEVVARARKPVVYLVANLAWRFNDSGYDACPEGGQPIRAFRSRQRAEAERQRLEAESRADYRYFDGFDLYPRLSRQQPFLPTSELRRPDVDDPSFPLFYEVIEVELDDLRGTP